jgi:hypothetical protein
MEPCNEITSKETKRILRLKKILFDISRARGTPDRLKTLITLLIRKIDKLLLDEGARKRLSTINLLIDVTKKLISILQWLK